MESAFERPTFSDVLRARRAIAPYLSARTHKDAIRLNVEKTHTIAEGGEVAPLAAVIKIGDRLRGRKEEVVLSGGNLTAGMLREYLGGSTRR